MRSISKAVVPAIAILAMVQYCPAPFIPAIIGAVAAIAGDIAIDAGTISGVVGAAAGVAGAVEGGIAGSNHHTRDIESKPRQFVSRIKRQDLSNLGLGTAWPDCHSQLCSAYLHFSTPAVSSVLVTGIPPACMTLSGVITGIYNEGNPIPMGSDSILFTNVSDEDILQIQNALEVHPNNQN